ncbi:probable WRKY transcription factor 35 [Benincasa hispida]|uniref:probable WRKY transcription factor 35 n=1 Tax=Benincasa hispida TaxID=102211 RepID=UPI0018FF354E|nr:probable WRKY transcription factor 35 [Benincasa hispida]
MFCSLFEMDDNYQQAGDLTDVIRPTSAAVPGGLSSEFSLDPFSGDRLRWPHHPADDSSMNFGDPSLFPTSSVRDPFLHPHFSAFNFTSDGGAEGLAAADQPSNLLSHMLQISPSSGDGVISTPPCESLATTVRNSPSSASTCGGGGMVPTGGSNPLCLMENSGIQISSPRSSATKRRKSQVKKVVCIPAPAPANSRSSSGEVVPSDLWAWRKYGQKPIKGSPYPRGYYRCSSSKGCSARKQVERSRTNPNMLVITYTSEHNHPWPTQRNALAGSTRSHPSRTPATATARKTSPKHEPTNDNVLPTAAVKEEEIDENQTTNKATTINDHQDEVDHQEFPYDLIFTEFSEQINNHDHDHNRDHHHLSADPLNNSMLMFSSHGFSTGNGESSKDPFLELYDWAENSNGSLFKEAKGG